MVKTGLLDYKDDLAEGGKKASGRKWKTCSVILTPQHLLIYVRADYVPHTAIADLFRA